MLAVLFFSWQGPLFSGKKSVLFFKSCASSGFAWQGPLFSGKRGSFFLSHVLAVVFPGRGLCFLEKRGPWISGRRRRRANNSGFWPGPCPVAPRDEISRKGKPLAPTTSSVICPCRANYPCIWFAWFWVRLGAFRLFGSVIDLALLTR